MSHSGSLSRVYGNLQVNTSSINTLTSNYKIVPLPVSGKDVSGTLGTSDILSGVISGTPVANIDLETPTAVQIVTAIAGAKAGVSFEVSVINLGLSPNVINLVEGAGITMVGNNVISPESSARFLFRITSIVSSSEAVSVYRLA